MLNVEGKDEEMLDEQQDYDTDIVPDGYRPHGGLPEVRVMYKPDAPSGEETRRHTSARSPYERWFSICVCRKLGRSAPDQFY